MNGFQYRHGDRPLEGYTIQRAVGRGGFGEVYFALSDSGREVALKSIQGYEQIELRGVSQCMNLKSPHLVSIFDVRHNDAGKPFVIMEYVAGPSLKDLLEQSPSGLGVQKAAFFLREMAKGLTFLHERGIVHRDLKPGNIFYEDGYVKIGDYGLSKAMSASRYSGQTITVGTVHYMAPEIGRGRYDQSIDIYALGVVLFEMLTGQVPYFGASQGEILMKHLMAEPDLAGIEEPFAGVIRKALAKEAGDRFASVQEMVEAVFGAEHVRNSVSCFTPDTLTMVAGRVAQKAAIGGPGSSGEVGRELGGGAPPAGAGSDVWETFGERADEFGRRMGEVGERLGRMGERVAERFDQVGTRLGRGFGLDAAPPAAKAAPEPALARTVQDTLDWDQRRLLGIVTAGLMAAGTGLLCGTQTIDPLWMAMFAFTVIAGAGGAIIGCAGQYLPRLQGESGLVRRLAFTGMASCFGVLCSFGYLISAVNGPIDDEAVPIGVGILTGPVIATLIGRKRREWRKDLPPVDWGRLIYLEPLALGVALPLFGLSPGTYRSNPYVGPKVLLGPTLLCIGITVFLLEWAKFSRPQRAERVSLGAAFWAGCLGLAFAFVLGGNPVLVGGIMAGLVLVVQVTSPFSLARVRTAPGTAEPDDDAAARRGNATIPNAKRRAAPILADPPPAATAHDWSGGIAPPAAGQRLAPAWPRVLFLAASLFLLGVGLLLLIWAGMMNSRDWNDVGPPAVGFGVGSLMLSLCFAGYAIRKRFRGWWSGVVRPFLMLVCISSVVTSATFLGAGPRLDDEETLVGLAFIIFPVLFLIVLAFISDRVIQSAIGGLPGTDTLLKLGATEPRAGVSPKYRLQTILLASAGFAGFGGLHRLYVGKIGTGLLWFFTWGLFGLGTIYDLVMLSSGRFTDSHGRPVITWDRFERTYGRNRSSHASQQAPRAEEVSAPTASPCPPQEPLVQEVTAGGVTIRQVVPRHSRSSEPRAARGPRANPFFTALAAMVFVPTLVLGVSIAVNLPSIIASGLPDPSLARELREDVFGDERWPELAQNLAKTVLFLGLLATAALLVLARRHTGAAHTGRAILGVSAAMLALEQLRQAFQTVPWSLVSATLSESSGPGAALHICMDNIHSREIVAAGVALLCALTLLCWPVRRVEAAPSNAGVPS